MKDNPGSKKSLLKPLLAVFFLIFLPLGLIFYFRTTGLIYGPVLLKIGDTMGKTFAEMREEALADPIERELIERESEAIRAAVRLAKIREQRKTTQVELATLMGASQANVSRIERSDNPYLSTLADYVAGLGGRLEINAVFDDDVVPVASVPSEVHRSH